VTYISVLPKNAAAESRLSEAGDALMEMLCTAAQGVLQIPENDIIVELSRCTTISFNRSAVDAAVTPDVVLAFATSDHELQARFPTLRDRVLRDWNDCFASLAVEVWFTLIDTWGTNTEVAWARPESLSGAAPTR